MITICNSFRLWCKTPCVVALLVALPIAASAATCPLKLTAGAADAGPVIQAAIDKCSAAGGGVLTVEAGDWTISPIHLKSHVTLNLLKGAKLIGTADFSKYPVTEQLIWQGVPQDRPLALISAQGQKEVALTGEGVVDGQGEPWWKVYHERRKATGEEMPRPWLVQFDQCSGVKVEGIEFRNSPAYTVVAYLSTDVLVRSIRILAPPDSPNTDGIVPYSSHHVRIEGSFVDSGDDNIAIKSSRPMVEGVDSSASDIVVMHCVFQHGHGATIGADTGGGVHDVTLSDIEFRGTTNGVRIKSAREMSGDVSHVTYENLRMTGTSPAITLSAYYPNIPKDDDAKPMADHTPRFHDIRILHVTAAGGQDAGSIIGLPESEIKEVQIEDLNLSSQTGLKVRNAEVQIVNSHLESATGPPLVREQNAHVAVKNSGDLFAE
jgi:polygalacturonase